MEGRGRSPWKAPLSLPAVPTIFSPRSFMLAARLSFRLRTTFLFLSMRRLYLILFLLGYLLLWRSVSPFLFLFCFSFLLFFFEFVVCVCFFLLTFCSCSSVRMARNLKLKKGVFFFFHGFFNNLASFCTEKSRVSCRKLSRSDSSRQEKETTVPRRNFRHWGRKGWQEG